jgi:hypothetical protein
VGAAALPGGAGQHRADRVHQAGVGVGDDELDTGQATGDQGTQEGEPVERRICDKGRSKARARFGRRYEAWIARVISAPLGATMTDHSSLI